MGIQKQLRDLLDLARNVGGISDGFLEGANPDTLRTTLLELRTDAREILMDLKEI
jgi:hypothetical protein